jgi:Heavy metal binding domain
MNVEEKRSMVDHGLPPSRESGGGPRGVVPPPVVAGRILLLLAAAGALVFGIVRVRSQDRQVGAVMQQYVCPMHPQIKSHAPGDCPICNMALVPVIAALSDTPGSANDERVVVEARTRVVARVLRVGAWVGADGVGRALLHKDDLVGLAAEEPVRFFGRRSPNMPLISADQKPQDSATVEVAFRLDRPAEHQQEGGSPLDVGSLLMDVRARKLLVVPTSAVLYWADSPYVLAQAANVDGRNRFEKRRVQVGRILDSGYEAERAGRSEGATVILSGLQEGEKVIAGYAFFNDVDRRLREAQADVADGSREVMR